MADKTVVVRIALKGQQFAQGLKQASNDTRQFATEVSRGTEKAAASTMVLGAASATAGKLLVLGVGGAMAVSAKAAIEFESSLAGVAKTTDLAGSAFSSAGSPLASFGEALRGLSMRIPVNVNELADIAALGGQLGVAVPDLVEFTEVVAAMGVSTNLSTQEAATGLARLANIMGTSHDEFGNLGSAIVALGNNFATTESEILTFALRLAPVGRTVGATEDEILAISAAMSSLGVPAERGGTAIQMLFISMAEAVEEAGGKLETFGRISGMTGDQFAELFADSPARALEAFVAGLDRITESGGSVFKTLGELDITQQRLTQVVLAAASGHEVLAEAINTSEQAMDEGTALQEEAARRYGTTTSQIQILGNAFRDLQIEIGNALLESGGLTAALDVVREFFGIVKENLPLLGSFAATLAGVAAIKVGASFFAMATNSIKSFGTAKRAADGLTRSMMLAKLASLGLNTAIFGLVGIAAILITKWAMASVEAAQLRGEIRMLNDEIQSGVDPVEAFTAALTEKGIISPELIDTLNKFGISSEQFVTDLMEGKNVLADMGAVGDTWEEKVQSMIRGQDRLGEQGVWLEMEGDLIRVNDALAQGEKFVGGFFDVQRQNLRDVLINTGAAADMTSDSMENLIDQAIRLFGINISEEEFLTLLSDDKVRGAGDKMRRNALKIGQGFIDGTRHWMDVLAADDREDDIGNFFDGITAAVDQFNVDMADAFSEVDESIRGAFPVWDEYEQVSIESLEAVTEAQELFMEDMLAGLALQDELQGDISGATMAWLSSLDTGTLAGLARFREHNESEFDEFIAGVESRFGVLGDTVASEWAERLPDVAAEGFNGLVAEAISQVDELGLPGEQSAQAFIDALEAQMQQLPADKKALFLSYIKESVFDSGMMFDIGSELGGSLIGGFAFMLAQMSAQLAGTIAQETGEMKDAIARGVEVDSPSKFTKYLGSMMTQGFFVGMDEEMDRNLHRIQPIFNPMMNQLVQMAPQTTVNVPRQPVGDINLTYNNPQMHDYTRELKRTELILTDLVHLTESRF